MSEWLFVHVIEKPASNNSAYQVIWKGESEAVKKSCAVTA